MTQAHYSDEMLNAFIDGELDVEDRARLLTAMRTDPALAARINELRAVRDLVRLACPKTEATDNITNPRRNLSQIAAATLLLAVGMLLGLVFAPQNHDRPRALENIAKAVNPYKNTGDRIVLQITTDNPDKLNVVLSETERLLRTHAGKPDKLQIAILANGKGMNLLRTANHDFSRRLATLTRKYPNLTLLACKETLRRLRREGVRVRLLPEVHTVPSALSEVIERQRAGWTHIQI